MVEEHCILLALPCGRDHMDVLQQSNNLRNGFINYLQSKQAAGIVNSNAPGSQQVMFSLPLFIYIMTNLTFVYSLHMSFTYSRRVTSQTKT